MPYQYPEIRKFLGLFAQQNSFDMPDGAMERAMNIVINDDNVVTKLRGFYQYFSPGSGTIKALTTYQNRLISVYADKIAYYTDTGLSPNEIGTETALTGSAVAVTGSRVPQFAESNGNLFFTTDSGVKVIDAYNGKVFDAGAPAGLDINGNFLALTGPITGNSSVAYRCLFGRRDANGNLIVGAPSDILVLANRKISATYTSSGAGPWTVTVTTPSAHNLSTGMQVVASGAVDADANGTFVVTVTTDVAFTYTVSSGDPLSGSIDIAAARATLLEFSVPEGISSGDGWFYQLYRSSITASASTSPSADFRLLDEKQLTAGEITAGVVSYQDTVDDFLVSFATELYTNPNSREGESQANFQPPLCEDICFFNNFMFFLNCESRHYLSLDLETVTTIVANDWIELQTYNTVTSTAVSTLKLVAKSGIGNDTTKASAANAAGDIEFTIASHGMSNGWQIYIDGISGGTLASGTYYVVSAGANTFKISLTSGGSAITYNSETSAYVQAVTDGTDRVFKLGSGSSASQNIQTTALGIVKAINRAAAFNVAANYASSINDVPGKMRLTSLTFKHQIRVRASSATVGSSFFPVVGTSFSATDAVKSSSDVEPNAVYTSKIGEPWAAPLLNKFAAGSKNQGIFRGLALRNSVLILKPDGVFKLAGDTPTNFSIVLIDNTVKIVSKKSAQATANQVYFLSSEGVCAATDSSVEILSRRIENRLENIVGLDNIDEQTAAVAYDTDRTYRICTIAPNETTATAVYLHNSINDTWTESDILFTGGTVGPGNLLFLISSNKILKERKKQNRLDYCGQNVATTIVSVGSDKLSAVISMTGTPIVGDLIEKSNQFSRIIAVAASGANWVVTFSAPTNLVAADTPYLYRGYESQWIMAPFHAGAVGRTKHFAQLQMHTRTPSVTRIKVDFIGQTFGGDTTTEWRTTNVAPSEGWGESPWGFFNWGLEDGIKNIYNTTPAPVIRLYVPLFQARSTFIKAILTHREAGEAIDAQALAWAIRGYNERVTK